MEKEERFTVIEKLLQILDEPLVVVDVGARWGFQEHWKRVESLVQLIGMDADVQEVQSLQSANKSEEFIPKVLGEKNIVGNFYVTQDPACGSLYRPDENLIQIRPSMYVTNLVSTEKVEITTLDSWIQTKKIPKVDFIKLDVQGAELDILKGSKRTLQTMRMMEVEVQFNPLYQGVPLFGDVDRFLREQGFCLWRIKNLCHYGLSEFTHSMETDEEIRYDYFTKRFKGRNGQLFWGDAFYVRNDTAFNSLRPWNVALQDACIAGILGFEDLFISSLKISLASCPNFVVQKIKETFQAGNATLAEIEADTPSTEAGQPMHIGLGLQDEHDETKRLKSQLDALKAEYAEHLNTIQGERDQALHDLNVIYQSRAFKMISFFQSIYGSLRSSKKL